MPIKKIKVTFIKGIKFNVRIMTFEHNYEIYLI